LGGKRVPIQKFSRRMSFVGAVRRLGHNRVSRGYKIPGEVDRDRANSEKKKGLGQIKNCTGGFSSGRVFGSTDLKRGKERMPITQSTSGKQRKKSPKKNDSKQEGTLTKLEVKKKASNKRGRQTENRWAAEMELVKAGRFFQLCPPMAKST